MLDPPLLSGLEIPLEEVTHVGIVKRNPLGIVSVVFNVGVASWVLVGTIVKRRNIPFLFTIFLLFFVE